MHPVLTPNKFSLEKLLTPVSQWCKKEPIVELSSGPLYNSLVNYWYFSMIALFLTVLAFRLLFDNVFLNLLSQVFQGCHCRWKNLENWKKGLFLNFSAKTGFSYVFDQRLIFHIWYFHSSFLDHTSFCNQSLFKLTE